MNVAKGGGIGVGIRMVGVVGIEPTTSCSQSRRPTAGPHPDALVMIRIGTSIFKILSIFTGRFGCSLLATFVDLFGMASEFCTSNSCRSNF